MIEGYDLASGGGLGIAVGVMGMLLIQRFLKPFLADVAGYDGWKPARKKWVWGGFLILAASVGGWLVLGRVEETLVTVTVALTGGTEAYDRLLDKAPSAQSGHEPGEGGSDELG